MRIETVVIVVACLLTTACLERAPRERDPREIQGDRPPVADDQAFGTTEPPLFALEHLEPERITAAFPGRDDPFEFELRFGRLPDGTIVAYSAEVRTLVTEGRTREEARDRYLDKLPAALGIELDDSIDI